MFTEVIAQINFFHSDSGGKNLPFGKGLSPRLVFDTSNIEHFTELNIDDSKTIFPGEQIKVELKIKSDSAIIIYKGLSFDLLENENLIGEGTILEILN